MQSFNIFILVENHKIVCAEMGGVFSHFQFYGTKSLNLKNPKVKNSLAPYLFKTNSLMGEYGKDRVLFTYLNMEEEDGIKYHLTIRPDGGTETLYEEGWQYLVA